NLAVIPISSFLLYAGFIASGAALVFPPAEVLAGQALHLLAQATFWLAQAAARPGLGHVYASAPTTMALAFYAAAMVLLRLAFTARRGRRWAWLGCAAALLLCAATWRPFSAAPEMDVLDVGHGDAEFIRTPGHGTMLVDAGDRSAYADLGRRAVAPFLW